MTPDLFLDSETLPKPQRKQNVASQCEETPQSPYRCPDLGFHFTEEDNLRIRINCRAAVRFMKTYGLAPAPPMIDLSHYINSKPEEQCPQEENTK